MMKEVTVTLVGIMLMLTILVTSSVSVIAESGKTWYVPDDFLTIKAAIDNNSVKSGDTIYVGSGTYYEGFNVNKSLTIVGENRDNTIIDLKGEFSPIYIEANDVTIKDFTIKNGHPKWFDIFIDGTSGNTITGNIINGIHTGIILFECKSGNNIITDNTITGFITGMNLDNSNNNLIKENIIKNSGSGVHLTNSNNNSITGNVITNCNGGIGLYNSSQNSIISNSIINDKITFNKIKNFDFGICGIILMESSDNTVGGTETSLKNAISHMEIGICFDDYSYSRITLRKDNNLKNNFRNIVGPKTLSFFDRLQNSQFIMQFLLNHPNAFPVLRNIYFSLP
jgi:nitrous oxidase accessory protein